MASRQFMSAVYKSLVKPLLFRLEPERAHELAIDGLAILARTPGLCSWMRAWNQLPDSSSSAVEAFGLSFPNRVGLAAGFDKNAVCWPAFEALGFGHVEQSLLNRNREISSLACFAFPSKTLCLIEWALITRERTRSPSD